MRTTLDYLQNTYGPLLTLDALAKILDRSPQGLRVSLLTDTPLSQAINSGRRKIGRRVYYKSHVVAQLIDEDILASD